MSSGIEFDTEDIQSFFGDKSVNLADLEVYVESQVNAQTLKPKPKPNPSQSGSTSNVFTISQEDYIAYQIYKRDRIREKQKKLVLLTSTKNSIVWLVKVILSVVLLMGICWGFYMLAWFVQTSIKLAMP